MRQSLEISNDDVFDGGFKMMVLRLADQVSNDGFETRHFLLTLFFDDGFEIIYNNI